MKSQYRALINGLVLCIPFTIWFIFATPFWGQSLNLHFLYNMGERQWEISFGAILVLISALGNFGAITAAKPLLKERKLYASNAIPAVFMFIFFTFWMISGVSFILG